MLIKNAQLLDSYFGFQTLDIRFEDKIQEINVDITPNKGEEVIDAKGYYLIPGLIDIHTHGAMGFDTCDSNQDGYFESSKYYKQHGVTSYLMTTMTLAPEQLINIAAEVGQFIDSFKYNKEHQDKGARPIGIYLEGPFISSEKIGAQNPKYVKIPDVSLLSSLNAASKGHLKLVTIAAEAPGAEEFIAKASEKYTVSIAHSNANYEQAMKAIEKGVTNITHLYNAMPPFNHREPGVIGAAYDSDVYTEIIVDGIHIHPAVVRATFKNKGKNKVILVSDSMSAAGMPEGEYELGGQKVFVKDGARLANGTLAGSTASLIFCVQKAVEFGIPLEEAIMAATLNPAKLLGMSHKIGSLDVGLESDMVILDDNLNIVRTFVKGL